MILVLNCGSSSLKFSLFDDLLNEVIKGIFERIGSHNSFCDFKKERIEQIFDTHKDALIFLFNKFTKVGINIDDIKIIGHRVAHGGNNNDSILVDYKVIEGMKAVNNLAPLHNPIQMSVVEACMELFPNIKNSLSFDTAFHHTIPDFAYTYAIPIELSEKYSIKK